MGADLPTDLGIRADQVKKLRQVEAVLHQHYDNPDLQVARIIWSAVAAHGFNGLPVWEMVIGPPGSMKTDLLAALEGLDHVHLVDEVTPNTFISGQIQVANNNAGSPSLLHRIGESGIIIFPDFSTVIGARSETRATTFAQLRRIYDGNLRREFGHTSGAHERRWDGRVTVLAAVTQEIERHYGVTQALGERFAHVRVPRPGGREAARRAMQQRRPEAKAELKQAVSALFEGVSKIDAELPDRTLEQLAAVAEFVVRARTHVPRNGHGKEILYTPVPEAPTRLAQQLAQLAKGSAVLAGRRIVADEDFQLARRTGFDSIPQNRRRILDALLGGENPETAEIPRQTLKYALEELGLVGLVQCRDRHYVKSDLAVELAGQFDDGVTE